jgi:enoyl-CoA hydratase/carnithine racemase
VLDGSPLLAVELGPGDDLTEAAPAWLPSVVVALSVGTPRAPAPAGVDVALCGRQQVQPPSGWVAVDDPDAELQRLGDQARRSPQASVTLVQVLRTSAGLGHEDALTVESLAYSTLQSGPAFTTWLAERRAAASKIRAEPDRAVLVERQGARLVLTLNRPQVRNAVDTRLRDALVDGLALACADPSIAAVELRGAGPDFSSGGDLDTFGTLPDPATAHLTRVVRSPARLLWRVGERVTAYVHGACVGAGVELAAFAARVVAVPDTRFQLPEVALGLVPGAGGTVSIPRRIGPQRTAWLALGGAELDAVTAAQWGLVDEIAAGS